MTRSRNGTPLLCRCLCLALSAGLAAPADARSTKKRVKPPATRAAALPEAEHAADSGPESARPRTPSGNPHLAHAIALERDLRYADMLPVLAKALAHPGTTPDETAAIFRLQGYAHAMQNAPGASEAAFIQLLTIAPGTTLGEMVSPRFQERFDAAKAAIAAHPAVHVEHTPPGKPGQAWESVDGVQVTFLVRDPLERARAGDLVVTVPSDVGPRVLHVPLTAGGALTRGEDVFSVWTAPLPSIGPAAGDGPTEVAYTAVFENAVGAPLATAGTTDASLQLAAPTVDLGPALAWTIGLGAAVTVVGGAAATCALLGCFRSEAPPFGAVTVLVGEDTP